MDAILEIRNLCCAYESRFDKTESFLTKLINPSSAMNMLLTNINITVQKGETLGIVGESGSGKSLTVRSIIGLLDFDPGIIQGKIQYTNGEKISLLDKDITSDGIKTSSLLNWLPKRTIQHRWHIELDRGLKVPFTDYKDGSLQITLYNDKGEIHPLDLSESHLNSNGQLVINDYGKYSHALVSATLKIPWARNLNSDIERVIRRWKKKGVFIRGHEISMIFQDPKTFLNPHWTVGEQLTNVLNIFKSGQMINIREELDALGLPNSILKSLVRDLSGGQIQRVMILLSKITKPKLLIADEPTTGLDVTRKREIVTQILNQKSNSMIFISHDLHMVRRISDRINIMLKGEVIENCGSEEFKQGNSLHPYAEKLLSIHESSYSDYLQEEPGDKSGDNALGCQYYTFCSKKVRVEGVCNIVSPPALDVNSHKIVSENEINIHWVKCWEVGKS